MAPEAEKAPASAGRCCGLSPSTWAIVATFLVLLAVDVSRPPSDQLSASVLLWSIDLYQATISPALAAGGARCRFEPSCSHYGEEAIRKYGTLKGVGLTARRILRCGPWTPAGTLDEP